jgi:hypothetical protein
MSKISKITVKHYLNTDLKPKLNNLYPIYIRIAFERKNYKIRSVLLTGYRDLNYNFNNENSKKSIEYETKIILYIIENLKSKYEISKILPRLTKDIVDLIKSEFYTDIAFNTDIHNEVKNELSNIISEKVKIERQFLDSILKIDNNTNNDFYKYFDSKLITNIEFNKYAEFIKALLDFIDLNYSKKSIYGYRFESLNCYEWKYNRGNLNFLEYCNKINKNFDNEILIINDLIDSYLTYF